MSGLGGAGLTTEGVVFVARSGDGVVFGGGTLPGGGLTGAGTATCAVRSSIFPATYFSRNLMMVGFQFGKTF